MISSENKIRFEIDHYDRHNVRWDWAMDPNKQFIWKTNLLGGGRLFHLIYRFSLLPTLKSFIKNSNWKEMRGFEGGNRTILKNVDRIIAIKSNGEPEVLKNVSIETMNLKDDFMYEPPFMIIDQILGENSLSACLITKQNSFTNKKRLYYNRDFIGISIPENDEEILQSTYNLISSKKNTHLNYQLYIVAKSSSCLVLTETDINKSEILDIPYPESIKDLSLLNSEKILQEDVLNYYRHLGKAITQSSSGFVLNKKVNEQQLKGYGVTLCDALNSIYAKNNKSWQLGKTYQTSLFIICQIGFGKDKGLPHLFLHELDESIASLLKENTSKRGTIYKRIVRLYKHQEGYDCLYLIKPHAFRYWLKSIALRDADDTFIDLKNEGL